MLEKGAGELTEALMPTVLPAQSWETEAGERRPAPSFLGARSPSSSCQPAGACSGRLISGCLSLGPCLVLASPCPCGVALTRPCSDHGPLGHPPCTPPVAGGEKHVLNERVERRGVSVGPGSAGWALGGGLGCCFPRYSLEGTWGRQSSGVSGRRACWEEASLGCSEQTP